MPVCSLYRMRLFVIPSDRCLMIFFFRVIIGRMVTHKFASNPTCQLLLGLPVIKIQVNLNLLKFS